MLDILAMGNISLMTMPAFLLVVIVIGFIGITYAITKLCDTEKTTLQELEPTSPVEDLSQSAILEDGRALDETAGTMKDEIVVSKEDEDSNGPLPLPPDEAFELEKRAVFSKVWICVSHSGRFSKPGDYHSVEIAGCSFFVILGKDYVLRAFHNVCRHRAYTILRKNQGSSLVLGCKYHGWSYSSKGELIKAPQFEAVEGFDKSQNGLFEIHTAISDDGFIFANLDGNRHVLAPDFQRIDEFARPLGLSKHSRWVIGWKEDSKIDWKASLSVEGQTRWSLMGNFLRAWHISSSSSCTLQLFPCTILKRLNSESWASVSFFPAGPGLTSIRCDIYGTKSGAMTEKDKAFAKAAVKILISNIKKTNCGTGQGSRKQLPGMDTRYRLRPLLDLHTAIEVERKRRIDPTRRHESEIDEDLDEELLCTQDYGSSCGASNAQLAW